MQSHSTCCAACAPGWPRPLLRRQLTQARCGGTQWPAAGGSGTPGWTAGRCTARRNGAGAGRAAAGVGVMGGQSVGGALEQAVGTGRRGPARQAPPPQQSCNHSINAQQSSAHIDAKPQASKRSGPPPPHPAAALAADAAGAPAAPSPAPMTHRPGRLDAHASQGVLDLAQRRLPRHTAAPLLPSPRRCAPRGAIPLPGRPGSGLAAGEARLGRAEGRDGAGEPSTVADQCARNGELAQRAAGASRFLPLCMGGPLRWRWPACPPSVRESL